MKKDLTRGNVTKTMLLFAGPMILGNLLQQCYNIADTLIVGHFLGPHALAAVGSSYTLMTFLNSIMIGLCMGSGAVFSQYFGAKKQRELKESIQAAFVLIGGIAVILNLIVFVLIDPILHLMQIPQDVYGLMRTYIWIVFFGILFVFLYNYFAFLLRALGNSVVPLVFLGVAAGLNIVLDLIFVIRFQWGVQGAALATVIAQGISGVGMGIYTWIKVPEMRPEKGASLVNKKAIFQILRFSGASCMQQSVMNLGILMIQGLVNSFGTAVMAAFAAAVKINSFAHMPAQEFSNAFSLFISQNYGAGDRERVKLGVKKAVIVSTVFCLLVSLFVWMSAPQLMTLFVNAGETEIIQIGTTYLRIEGACYVGIGLLVLLYGYYRAIERPEMSLVLTVISLGSRVLIAYTLAPKPTIGVLGIWWAIPIGWALADITGFVVMKFMKPAKFRE